MTPAVFLDASVLLLALGGESVVKRTSMQLIAVATEGRCALHLSVEAVQEVVFHRMRRTDRARALLQGREIAALAVVHPFDEDVLRRSLLLVETTAIRGRDAVHAATAMAHGFDAIVTTDRDFETVPGLEVLDPAAVLARL